MLQLNPPLPMLTPKGEGLAHILIDYGPESDLYWTVFITDTGEVWTFSNREVRAAKNITLGRTHVGCSPLAAEAIRARDTAYATGLPGPLHRQPNALPGKELPHERHHL